MKVGLIVYSETGHTLSVVTLLKKAFEKSGDQAYILPLEVKDTRNRCHLLTIPETEGFDLVVICGPVQGFQMAQPVMEFLNQTHFPKKQKVSILLTQYFKKAWLGGNHALKMVRKSLEKDSVEIMNEAIIHWSAKTRDTDITEVINRMIS